MRARRRVWRQQCPTLRWKARVRARDARGARCDVLVGRVHTADGTHIRLAILGYDIELDLTVLDAGLLQAALQ